MCSIYSPKIQWNNSSPISPRSYTNALLYPQVLFFFLFFNVSQHTTHFLMLFLFNVSVMFVDHVAYVALTFFQHRAKKKSRITNNIPRVVKIEFIVKLWNQIMRCNKWKENTQLREISIAIFHHSCNYSNISADGNSF